MKTKKYSRKGSVLLLVLIFTTIATLSIGAMFSGMFNYARMNQKAYQHDRSVLLADAALAAVVVDLRNGGSGIISSTGSVAYFSQTRKASARQRWGFQTALTNDGVSGRQIAAVGQDVDSSIPVYARAARNVSLTTIHSLYAFAIYAGNSSGDTNYTLTFGGTGTGADYVNGDVYCGGDIALSGDAKLRHPEAKDDANGDGYWNEGENWTELNSTLVFSNAIAQAEYDAYVAERSLLNRYGNGKYDPGEAFLDSLGNGVFDAGEGFVDVDGDGVFGFGDSFEDTNGNGLYDAGENFVDRGNGQYDAGEDFQDLNGNGTWDAATAGYNERYWSGGRWRYRWVPGTAAEPYEDVGNGVYDTGEEFADRDGVYTPGEAFYDDRNGKYDYGTQATGEITGMPAASPGQPTSVGGDAPVNPPDLTHMFYEVSRSNATPVDAISGWGHDVNVASGVYNSSGKMTNWNDPRHIFRKNPTDRSYTKITGNTNNYFLEDPSDSSYGQSSQLINVRSNGNNKVYFVDGNLWIHNPNSYDFMFRQAGTKITIIANGNITLSDEFWYNGGTANPQDFLVLIAKKKDGVANSGNIYLGDATYGTGGDIHGMLYAENNFVDNNLNTADQPYLSVFGNMTAGNQVNIMRSGTRRTRLDVTLDERIYDGSMIPPGLPGAPSGERDISLADEWGISSGSWFSHSNL